MASKIIVNLDSSESFELTGNPGGGVPFADDSEALTYIEDVIRIGGVLNPATKKHYSPRIIGVCQIAEA